MSAHLEYLSNKRIWSGNGGLGAGAALLLAVIGVMSYHGMAAAPALALLPDNRAYELVSPAQKNGGVGGVFALGELTFQPEQFGRPLQSSTAGNSVVYGGEDFYEPKLGSINEYLSTIGPEAWATANLTLGVPSARETAVEANTFVGFNQALSVGVISSNVPLGEDPTVPLRYANLYVDSASGMHAVVTVQPPNRSPYFRFGWAHPLHGGAPVLYNYLFFGGGNDGTATVPAFSHVLFAANDALTPNAVDRGKLADNLYEWFDGQVRLVNMLPDGTDSPNASFGVDHNDEYRGPHPNLDQAISADGSRILWTGEDAGSLTSICGKMVKRPSRSMRRLAAVANIRSRARMDQVCSSRRKGTCMNTRRKLKRRGTYGCWGSRGGGWVERRRQVSVFRCGR